MELFKINAECNMVIFIDKSAFFTATFVDNFFKETFNQVLGNWIQDTPSDQKNQFVSTFLFRAFKDFLSNDSPMNYAFFINNAQSSTFSISGNDLRKSFIRLLSEYQQFFADNYNQFIESLPKVLH